MVGVGIIGSTGMVGEGLVRILAGHPEARLAYLASDHAAGRKVGDVMPGLKGEIDAELRTTDTAAIAESCDVCFLAKKSADSMELVPALLEKKVKCIDIGGEFRRNRHADWPDPGHDTGVFARLRMIGRVERGGDFESVVLCGERDEPLAHSTRRSMNGDSCF